MRCPSSAWLGTGIVNELETFQVIFRSQASGFGSIAPAMTILMTQSNPFVPVAATVTAKRTGLARSTITAVPFTGRPPDMPFTPRANLAILGKALEDMTLSFVALLPALVVGFVEMFPVVILFMNCWLVT